MSKRRSVRTAILGGLATMLTGATTGSFNKHQKAFFADASVVAFVRPGLTITITSA